MRPHEREALCARVSSGLWPLRVTGRRLFSGPLPRAAAALAEEAYEEALQEALAEGLPDEAEHLAALIESRAWSEAEERALAAVPKEIEDLKVELHEAWFSAGRRKNAREALASARRTLSLLLSRRHRDDHLSAHGAARAARHSFRVAFSLLDASLRPVYSSEEDYHADCSGLASEASALLDVSRPSEADLRELARTEPWRSTWACREAGPLFSGPPTESQAALVSFTRLYEQVWAHPNCPPDEAVDDDDSLDGWLIKQKRTRGGDSTAQDLHPGKPEVYIMADTPEDAARVMALNGPNARAELKQRFAAIDRSGSVSEQEMPHLVLRAMADA